MVNYNQICYPLVLRDTNNHVQLNFEDTAAFPSSAELLSPVVT